MPVAQHLKAIRISNFRSIVAPLEVPLTNKMTFLVGQNNSGKTGILRFFGLLLNAGAITDEDKPTFTTKATYAEFVIGAAAISEFAKARESLPLYLRNEDKTFTLQKHYQQDQNLKPTNDLFEIIDPRYFDNANTFMKDFSSSGGREANVVRLIGAVWPTIGIPKTVYVPSNRFILNGGMMPHFGQAAFPGQAITMNTVVQDLKTLDRPSGTTRLPRDDARKKLSNICNFIAYCLEVKTVLIEVPSDSSTIYVKIDDNEQPISNLGSGIEQLIVIGMGSFMFPGQLVLIDEPEIHFHPRTQKRMMKYLYDHADAKFVIATHSAAILDSVDADIVQITQENQQCIGRTINSNSERYEAIRNLGHSPSELVLANFVIWAEGPSDRIYLNHWIKKLDNELVEGTDYSIVFYGGSVLARHSFDDGDTDLVKALSIAKSFAVYMDSDRSQQSTPLKGRVNRIRDETEKNKGMAWISAGREIENYVPQSVLDKLPKFKIKKQSPFEQTYDPENFDKVAFAEKAVAVWGDDWPLDLRERCAELVKRIRDAR